MQRMTPRAVLASALASMLALTLALLLVTVLGGCALEGGDTVLDADDEGTVVEVTDGSSIVVELEGNPTTGYEWAPSQEPTFLQLEEPVSYEPDSDLIGSGGTFRFRYLVAGTGEGRLAFEYARSFEETAPVDVFAVELVAE